MSGCVDLYGAPGVDPADMRDRHAQRRAGAFMIEDLWAELFAIFVLPLNAEPDAEAA